MLRGIFYHCLAKAGLVAWYTTYACIMGGVLGAPMDTDAQSSQSFRTRLSIVDILDELVKEKSYDDIKVTELCRKAGISRTTFYYYFEDKNAVLQWHSDFVYNMGIYEIGRSLTWYEGHYVTTSLIDRHKELYLAAGRSIEYSAVRPTFRRRRIANLEQTLVDYQHVELTNLLRFEIMAAAGAESEMSNYRLDGTLNLSVADHCSFLEKSVPRELHEALKDPVNEQDSLVLAIINGLT